MLSKSILIKFSVAVAMIAGAVFADASGAKAQTTGDIVLQGTIGLTCSITVSTLAAAGNLSLTGGATHVQVGNVAQICNDNAGYRLTVTSLRCSDSPGGAKLESGSFPGVNTYLPYSVEFVNPTTGGSSADVTNLLVSSCTNQIARDVTLAQIPGPPGETSNVFINYTGNAGLVAGTYTDTITVTMTTK